MADVTISGPGGRTVGWLARAVEAILAGAVLAFALRLRLLSLDAYTGSFDEGIRSEQLLLMSAGFRPFRDIFASQGPLLLDLLYPFFAAFGQTLSAARLGVVACSIVALVGAWWTARLVAGPVGGLAALAILGISRVFLEGSRLALAEVPTIAPALLAIGAAVAYRQTRDRRLLVVSAAWCALALLVKPMVLHVGAPLAVLLMVPTPALAREEREHYSSSLVRRVWGAGLRRTVLDLLIYGAVVAGICAAVIAFLGPAQVWDNLGAYRTGAGHQAGADVWANLRLTFNVMVQEQPGLYVLAGAGVVLGLWRQPALTVALLAWVLAILGLFSVYGDLADKHIVYLVPPVALLAALAVGNVARSAGAVMPGLKKLDPRPLLFRSREGPGRTGDDWWRGGRLRWQLLALAVGVVGIAAYIWFIPALYRADVYLIREAPKIAAERRGRAVDQEIAQIIRSHTPEGGWVLADNPNAAFEARRLVIPYLVDTSGTRIDAGSLTTQLALDQIDKYRPNVVVTWPRRLGKLNDLVRSLPGRGYRLERSYDLGWKVYVRD